MAHATTPSSRSLAYLNEVKEMPQVAILAVEFAVCVSKWTTRRRTRRALKKLTVRQLDDVGLTPEQARHEAAKVFWRA
ncbi:DUF1127 domain-containing protein [Roseobacter sinensis]|uniref:DUF1127 domain-containing protein n=1 Tax=Roseobacter sinensis TaxID=2931391 RepID=A0ABT3BBM0_9RHOB|nr:DUF1127 domain-containing protein [Roseobacter sp. WL0113]MCV3270955.1 DUF1127 domain-containing protein [Roseobacter sp. WL0113]